MNQNSITKSRQLLILTVILLTCHCLHAQNYQLNGNLGLGTNPDAKLDVDGDSKLRGDTEVEGDLKLKDMGDSDDELLDKLLVVDSEDNVKKITSTDFLEALYLNRECAEVPIGEPLYNPIWGSGPGAMFLRCPVGVKLGVGTDSPQNNLHVIGSGRITQGLRTKSLTTDNQLEVNGVATFDDESFFNSDIQIDVSNDSDYEYGIRVLGGTDNAKTFVVRHDNLDAYSITGNGRLDINSDLTSSARLRVYSPSANLSRFEVRGTGEIKSRMESGDFWDACDLSATPVYKFRVDGSIKTFIDPTSSSASLELTRRISPTESEEIFRFEKDGSIKVNLQDGPSHAVRILDAESPSEELFSISASGNLNAKSINSQGTFSLTDSDGIENFKVEESGDAYARKVTVQLGNFPDYVFEPDYELMSLAELRAYINANNRLPNMPSAQEVAANGANIGELNRLMVENIEELTLYILELEQKISDTAQLNNQSQGK